MVNPRLLIVDDSVNLTLFYREELEDDGYHVDVADSFTTAVELLGKKIYDLVIVETMLRDVEEFGTLQNKLNGNGEIPLIINTASSLLEKEFSLWSVNADACIMKSSDVTMLKEKIKILIDNFGRDYRTIDVHQPEKVELDKSYKKNYEKIPYESFMYLR